VDSLGVDWKGQAAKKAVEYLENSSFSKSGLIEQLKYEGFLHADAVEAVNILGVDWRMQAAKKAAEYLKNSSLSESGLIEQLVYEGFTQEQAQFGAAQAY
jgi:colicin import membrane protein